MKIWKLRALLSTPMSGLITVAALVLASELLLMELIHELYIDSFQHSHILLNIIDAAMLAAVLVWALYFLVFRGMREKEQRFQLLYDSARDAIITVNDQALISGWNDAAQQLFQYRAEEALGQPMHQLIAPLRYRDDAVCGFARFQETGEGAVIGKTIEIAALRKDGSEFPVELSISSVTLKGRRHAMGIVRDITERKQAERRADEQLAEIKRKNEELHLHQIEMQMQNEELQRVQKELSASQAHYADLYDFAPVGYCTISGETRLLLQANLTAAAMLGVAREALLKQRISHFIYTEDQDIFYLFHKKLIESGEPESCEIRLKRKDGTQFWVNLSATSAQGGDGTPVVRITLNDISERKQAEKLAAVQLDEIERARLEWQAVFDSISDPIFIHDEALHITRANLAYARAGGMDIHDVIGQPYWKVFPRADGPMRSCQLAIEESREETEEIVVGDEVYLSRSFVTKKLPGTQYSVHIFENISERKLALASQLQSAKQLRAALEDMISAIAATLEQRDPYTAGHQRRVAQLAVSIGREMGLPGDALEGLHFGGLIHDIGKISVPAEILGKPGLLSDIEFSLIKVHAEAGYEILKNITFPWPVAQMVYQHHERLDGSGYPQGLAGEQIILEARILAVADTVEAMSANRPYRPGLGIEAALNEITRLRGTALDPLAVDACLRLIREKGFEFAR